VAVRIVSPSISESEQTRACDPKPPEQLTAGQTQPLQGAHDHNVQVFSTTETALRQPLLASTPLSPSPNLSRQLIVDPHPNPLRDVRMGERPSFPQPLQLATPHHQPLPPPPLSTPGTLKHIDPQSRRPPPMTVRSDPTNIPQQHALDPQDVGSIPHPSGLSQKNLRAAMGLDRTDATKGYYSRIRVSAPTWPFHLLTHRDCRTSFAGT
jgi:hypothetical protein